MRRPWASRRPQPARPEQLGARQGPAPLRRAHSLQQLVETVSYWPSLYHSAGRVERYRDGQESSAFRHEFSHHSACPAGIRLCSVFPVPLAAAARAVPSWPGQPRLAQGLAPSRNPFSLPRYGSSGEVCRPAQGVALDQRGGRPRGPLCRWRDGWTAVPATSWHRSPGTRRALSAEMRTTSFFLAMPTAAAQARSMADLRLQRALGHKRRMRADTPRRLPTRRTHPPLPPTPAWGYRSAKRPLRICGGEGVGDK